MLKRVWRDIQDSRNGSHCLLTVGGRLRLTKLSCAAQQVGIVHFYAVTEIKGLSCRLWWMREWRNLLTSTHVGYRSVIRAVASGASLKFGVQGASATNWFSRVNGARDNGIRLYICWSMFISYISESRELDYFSANQIDGLVQERRNSSALAMELRLSCTNPSKCTYSFTGLTNPERWVTSERCKQQITSPHVWRVSSQTWRPRIQGSTATWLQTSTLSRGQVSSDKWPRDRGTPCEEKGTPTSWF